MESVFSPLAQGFLLFSKAIILLPLLLIGFATRGGFFMKLPSREGSRIWGNAGLMILFTMIFNAFLKSLFLIPLNPALGIKGFAFPSGHMQAAFVFYGALFRAYPQTLFPKILVLILAGVGYGLIQQGYHDLTDVVGAVGFGVATLYVFSKITNTALFQNDPSQLGLYLIPLAGLLVAGIELRIGLSPHTIKTFIGLIGFSLLWWGLAHSLWKK